jgi:hypothetical protein
MCDAGTHKEFLCMKKLKKMRKNYDILMIVPVTFSRYMYKSKRYSSGQTILYTPHGSTYDRTPLLCHYGHRAIHSSDEVDGKANSPAIARMSLV